MSIDSTLLGLGPIAYWRQDETSGTSMADASGNGRTGTYVNSPTLGQASLIPSDTATSVKWDGVNDRASVAHNAALNATTSGWSLVITGFKIVDPSANKLQVIIDKTAAAGSNGQWSVWYDNRTTSGSPQRLVFACGTDTVGGIGTLRTATWEGSAPAAALVSAGRLVCVSDATGNHLFWNGVEVGTASVVPVGFNSGNSRALDFSSLSGGSSSWFDGSTQKVALFNRALTTAEIASIEGAANASAVSGGHVSESDVGRAGSVKAGAVVAGGHAQEADAPHAGSIMSGQAILGGHVSETDTPHTATLRLIQGGGHVSETDTSRAGVVTSTVTGGHVTETDTTHGGAITVVIPGGIAHEIDAAHGHSAGATVGGHVAEIVTLYPGSVTYGYATPRKVRAGGRRRTGLGQGFWEPAVVAPPATVTYGDERVIAHAFTVPTFDGMQPRFDVTSADEPQHRDRILVGGVDVTYFRDALTPTPTYQLVEPLLYGPATLSLPQVAACFETPGVGALSWLKPGKTVKVQRVDRDTGSVVATDYVGVVIAFDTNGNELTVQIGGEASGRAALRYWPVPIFRSVHDIGRWVFHAVHSLGVRFKPYLGPDTGIELARFGGTGHLDYITQLCARAQNRDGAQWTVTKNGDHYEMVQKDRTTVHGTVYLDDARAVGSLRRDLAEEPNRIYGTGVTPEGQRILGGVYPGVQKTDPAPYPYHDGRTFGLGTQDADTDTGDGVTVMVSRLRICRYMGAADAPGGFDKDVVRAVKALQDDAGLAETGVMNQATWNALYDLGATGMSLRWSKILPMAQKPYTREWRRSGSGALMSRNPNYDPSRLVVDRDVDFGSGYRERQMREWSRNEIDQSEDNWVGDIQLYSGAVVAGDHTPGDPITSILRARDIKPGMNLRLPLFAGGILVHVSAVSVDSEGLVTCSVDTRARDSLEVWEIIARNRETRRSPARAWEHQYRASGMVHDAVDGWSEVGGELGARTPLHGGEWNIVEVVAGQTGTIQKLLLETNPNAEFAVAVFGAKISAATLNHRVGNPLTATGKDKWSDETVNAILKRDHLLLFAAGDDGSPCGYSPRSKGGSNPLTGKYEDAAGFSYSTQQYPVLYVAIYPDRNTSIPAGRVMWPQLEAGA